MSGKLLRATARRDAGFSITVTDDIKKVNSVAEKSGVGWKMPNRKRGRTEGRTEVDEMKSALPARVTQRYQSDGIFAP
jgi:hypothetical protein